MQQRHRSFANKNVHCYNHKEWTNSLRSHFSIPWLVKHSCSWLQGQYSRIIHLMLYYEAVKKESKKLDALLYFLHLLTKQATQPAHLESLCVFYHSH